MGLSLLCGMFNLRLGHWWGSGTEPNQRSGAPKRQKMFQKLGHALSRGFPVQMHFLDEFFARFHGTARRNWYLTDGGHFENTGCYELVRRRVPFIIVLDNGEDPAYQFEDVSALVRKARLDFGAEIRFLGEDEMKNLSDQLRPLFGPLSSLAAMRSNGNTTEWSRSCAALATVTYADQPAGPSSVILLIKPVMRGDEPQDVLQYALAHRPFPQQPSANQFFDEAQWESYRKLGEHIGNKVFGPCLAGASRGTWLPRSFDPAPFL
jgi:hypothetical protein